MSNGRKRIPKKVKSQILLELATPGSAVTQLSRKYGVSGCTIHKWRKEQQLLVRDSSDVAILDAGNEFVELSVLEQQAPSTSFSIQKASLVFRDLSISIEGSISNAKLISILKILEAPCRALVLMLRFISLQVIQICEKARVV